VFFLHSSPLNRTVSMETSQHQDQTITDFCLRLHKSVHGDSSRETVFASNNCGATFTDFYNASLRQAPALYALRDGALVTTARHRDISSLLSSPSARRPVESHFDDVTSSAGSGNDDRTGSEVSESDLTTQAGERNDRYGTCSSGTDNHALRPGEDGTPGQQLRRPEHKQVNVVFNSV
jgi:hypothetical protein